MFVLSFLLNKIKAPIQGEVAILLDASSYRNQVKLCPLGYPVAQVRLYLWTKERVDCDTYISSKGILLFSSRKPHESKTEAILVEKPQSSRSKALMSTLIASGFTLLHENQTGRYFAPCPVGTFSNFSSQGAEGCMKCPPGNLNKFSRIDSLSS